MRLLFYRLLSSYRLDGVLNIICPLHQAEVFQDIRV